jgi:hypothetical protein
MPMTSPGSLGGASRLWPADNNARLRAPRNHTPCRASGCINRMETMDRANLA